MALLLVIVKYGWHNETLAANIADKTLSTVVSKQICARVHT